MFSRLLDRERTILLRFIQTLIKIYNNSFLKRVLGRFRLPLREWAKTQGFDFYRLANCGWNGLCFSKSFCKNNESSDLPLDKGCRPQGHRCEEYPTDGEHGC